MQLPEGCFSASNIPMGLSIGYDRFYRLRKKHPLPKPAGIYTSSSPSKKVLPYWHIDALRKWLDSATK